ncbi:MAG: M20/M25/M40 family metallo-hydrolase [Candidatus Blackburnbacteria bacterium]|nr:M20/M25/M40 family metallo-hydrolase [Candidatus Blackburnbacteria bacterium]
MAKQFVSPQMGTTTLNLAYLRGGLDDGLDKDGVRQFGKEGNNIPDLAQFVIDVRPATPDLNAQQILEMIEASCKEQKVELEETSIRHDLGAWLSPIEDAQDALDIIRQQVGTVNLKDPGSFGYVDVAMLWQKLRCSAVVVGPGARGTAHSNNEHVVEDEVYKAAELFKRIIEKYQR